MLLKRDVLEKIKEGRISQVFRRWKQPTVKSGGTLHTVVGLLRIEQVEPFEESQLSETEARKAGFPDREALLRELNRRASGSVYRIVLKYEGEDPRIALRNSAALSEEEVARIAEQLDRYDRASRRGPWTAQALMLIQKHPGRLAAELAAMAGQDKAWFKAQIRKLKALGLTESLEIGYRISPRGKAFLKGSQRHG